MQILSKTTIDSKNFNINSIDQPQLFIRNDGSAISSCRILECDRSKSCFEQLWESITSFFMMIFCCRKKSHQESSETQIDAKKIMSDFAAPELEGDYLFTIPKIHKFWLALGEGSRDIIHRTVFDKEQSEELSTLKEDFLFRRNQWKEIIQLEKEFIEEKLDLSDIIDWGKVTKQVFSEGIELGKNPKGIVIPQELLDSLGNNFNKMDALYNEFDSMLFQVPLEKEKIGETVQKFNQIWAKYDHQMGQVETLLNQT